MAWQNRARQEIQLKRKGRWSQGDPSNCGRSKKCQKCLQFDAHLTLLDWAGLELTEICLPLPPECHHTQHCYNFHDLPYSVM